ncbi:SDR family NAD(P)-dependent oxidoreductase [Microvirga antarctica]|uniref:SDR family NAD(P)-dependent oxidoreductase n=1 Tax=Microvirga antarctica TaxID=2819233 RepID=UPI0031BAA530
MPFQISDEPFRAVVIGASGGIGAALVERLRHDGVAVSGLSRSASGASHLDLEDEESIAAAAAGFKGGDPVRLVILATGILHDGEDMPEKAYRQLDPDSLSKSFRINAIGPALVAKHFLPLLPRKGRAVLAVLSARVGSIADNRLGGWYGYRASKAALNQLVRTAAIELARQKPEALCVSLHPGTVATALSAPFRSGVAPEKLFTAEESADHLLAVLSNLRAADSGGFFAWDGTRIAF